nr:reverse transcriptase domain-containing protein [Tanacetum cinerariifolium]
MNVMIVRSPSPYNGIIGRPGIIEIQAAPSTAHEMLKFLVNGGIVTICSTILTPTECTTIAATPKYHAKKAEARHENFKVAIHPDFPDQEITIGGTLSIKARMELCTLLKRNLDIFAWRPSDMEGGQAPERAKAIQVEVPKLVDAGILQEVYYHDWLSNSVMVKMYDGSWRMCVDFTDLNKSTEGMFLGYMINPEGIKPCPDNTEAVQQLPSPRTIKEVQSLNEKLASLNRFISKSAEKSLPLFNTLKKCIKKSEFQWTPDVEQAFKQLKQHLAKLPMQGHSLDTGLFCESSDAGSRAKVYPDGKASPGASLRSQEVAQILPGASHRGHHRPTHQASQILADFLVEKSNDAPPEASVIKTPQESWTLFTNESSCADGSGARLTLTSPEGTEFTYALRFQFTASNNEAAYEALIAGLRIVVLVEVLKVKSIQEKEVATVLKKEGPTWMTPIMEYLKDGTLSGDRKEASKLRIKARQYELLKGVLYRRSFLKPWLRSVGPLQADYVIRKIHEGSCTAAVTTPSAATTPRNHLSNQQPTEGWHHLHSHHTTSNLIHTTTKSYPHHRSTMAATTSSAEPPYHLRQPPNVRPLLHATTSAANSQQNAGTIFTATTPPPTSSIPPSNPIPTTDPPWLPPRHQPNHLTTLVNHQMWTRKGQVLIVAMDYFTKWIEAKAVATIIGSHVKKFVWDNIVCRFDLPGEIVSDNGKQFSNNPFKDWCEKLNITQHFASIKHPQSNGLVERANRSLGEGIKARLDEGNKNWIEKLPCVLWAHRTMIKSSHGDTPFSLTYGMQAVIPEKIRMPTYRTEVVDTAHNNKELRLNLDLLEERSECTAIREAKSKSKMTKYYNNRVCGGFAYDNESRSLTPSA